MQYLSDEFDQSALCGDAFKESLGLCGGGCSDGIYQFGAQGSREEQRKTYCQKAGRIREQTMNPTCPLVLGTRDQREQYNTLEVNDRATFKRESIHPYFPSLPSLHGADFNPTGTEDGFDYCMIPSPSAPVAEISLNDRDPPLFALPNYPHDGCTKCRIASTGDLTDPEMRSSSTRSQLGRYPLEASPFFQHTDESGAISYHKEPGQDVSQRRSVHARPSDLGHERSDEDSRSLIFGSQVNHQENDNIFEEMSQGSENEQKKSLRRFQDAFLLQARRDGLGYKQIKKLGRFSEAVSTLRGRFRSLTKPKSQRIRNPQWADRDIQLLVEAVNKLFPSTAQCELSTRSWKGIAAYISNHGGSYKFSTANCKKKWAELQQHAAPQME